MSRWGGGGGFGGGGNGFNQRGGGGGGGGFRGGGGGGGGFGNRTWNQSQQGESHRPWRPNSLARHHNKNEMISVNPPSRGVCVCEESFL